MDLKVGDKVEVTFKTPELSESHTCVGEVTKITPDIPYPISVKIPQSKHDLVFSRNEVKKIGTT